MFLLWAVSLASSDFPNRPKLVHLTPRQLDAISAHCHSPRHWLSYGPNGELHVRPSAVAKYQQVDCILSQLKGRGAAPMAFVGNERP